MKKPTKKTKPLRIKGLASNNHTPLLILGNGLEICVATGDEMKISQIVVNGRVFLPKP